MRQRPRRKMREVVVRALVGPMFDGIALQSQEQVRAALAVESPALEPQVVQCGLQPGDAGRPFLQQEFGNPRRHVRRD